MTPPPTPQPPHNPNTGETSHAPRHPPARHPSPHDGVRRPPPPRDALREPHDAVREWLHHDAVRHPPARDALREPSPRDAVRHPSPRRVRSERGSGTLLTLFAGLLLATALAMAILWSAISVARHKLAATADLTALSAAQSLQSDPSTPCATAARIAALHQATLAACEVTADSVTIQVAAQLHLAQIAHPTLTATARAGPA